MTRITLSPCQIGEPGPDEMIRWRPVESNDAFDWDSLGLQVRQELKDFYASFYCGESEFPTPRGNVVLTLFWNREERDGRLAAIFAQAAQTNRFMVGYFLDDRFLAVDGETGGVYLEDPGRDPELFFESLADFLQSLVPG